MPSLWRVLLLYRPMNSLTAQQVYGHVASMTEIESVQERIASHEKQEAKIARKYGIPGNVDSAAILQAVKDKAWNSVDSQHPHDELLHDAEVLDDLLNFRNEQFPEPTDLESSPVLDPARSWGIIIGIDAYHVSPFNGVAHCRSH
ncbi:uncharacterized protein EV420DRAFT_1768397 [Desarmillaria tabescens]|uniref:Uncharacterized protein n=1 Tax=Armillaria tabescens TaxID=1929756 RepID=A0AA39MRU1_ARMTA|nr:uncharacterized protein EV420DRAFT_1768397 [Desarmillaria tabescens]KAK0444287.1 hypothetical protein EV420DRAFT_1768397 [Desarmillaria tabescens]